jgi:hypothetical protein
MKPEPHVIKEIAPGVHWALLDFPGTEVVETLLNPQVPYVLCWGGHLGHWRWEKFMLPISSPLQPEPVLARAIEVDFVVETSRFLELLPSLGPGVSAVQLDGVPQDHLDLRRIKGPELWRLLAEVGWYVWCDVPGNDFAQVASPHRRVVEQAVEWTKNDR